MSFQTFIYVFWLVALTALAYIYFFHPDIFYQMMHSFQGPGGPQVNNP